MIRKESTSLVLIGTVHFFYIYCKLIPITTLIGVKLILIWVFLDQFGGHYGHVKQPNCGTQYNEKREEPRDQQILVIVVYIWVVIGEAIFDNM